MKKHKNTAVYSGGTAVLQLFERNLMIIPDNPVYRTDCNKGSRICLLNRFDHILKLIRVDRYDKHRMFLMRIHPFKRNFRDAMPACQQNQIPDLLRTVGNNINPAVFVSLMHQRYNLRGNELIDN